MWPEHSSPDCRPEPLAAFESQPWALGKSLADSSGQSMLPSPGTGLIPSPLGVSLSTASTKDNSARQTDGTWQDGCEVAAAPVTVLEHLKQGSSWQLAHSLRAPGSFDLWINMAYETVCACFGSDALYDV